MKKTRIMDETEINRALARMTHEILEQNRGTENICLLGVKTRGIPLAARLAKNIEKFEGVSLPIGRLDITLHRDDLTEEEKKARQAECHFPCDITGKTVIIADDVLYTGRTVRAAIEAVFAVGRPQSIRLAVLIDRGHRELPIRPDYIGKNVPTSKNEKIAVYLEECDSENGVYLCDSPSKN